MALQTIQQRILDQLGDTVSGVMEFSALMIKDWVNLGIRVIVGRTPVKKCKQIYPTKPSNFAPSTGMTIETAKIISVLREDGDSIPRKCDEILYEDISEIDVNSNYAPSLFKPKYTLEPQTGGTVKVMIYPASVSTIGTVVYVSYPEVDPSVLTTLAGFPEELEPYVDLYAVIQGKIRALGYYRKIINDEVSAVSGTTAISNTPFTAQTSVVVTHNLGYYPLVQILDANGVEIGGEVEHDTATKNFYTVTFLYSETGTIITSVPNSSGGDLDSFVSALPTWSAVTIGTMPTAPTLVSDISVFIAANPLPTAPTIVSDISTFIASNALPTPPTLVSDISAFISANALPTFDGTTTVTLGDISTTRVFAALDVAIGLIGTQATTFLAAHDTEEARESSVAAGAQVGIASEELKTELAKLGNWEGEYKSKVANFSSQIDAWFKHWKTFVDEDTVALALFKENLDSWMAHWKSFTDEDDIAIKDYLAKLDSWFKHWKSFIDEDSIAITLYKERVTEIIVTFKADIENESQRFGLAMAKAKSYLEAAQIRLGIINGYLQSLQLLPAEITLLQKNFDIGVNAYLQD